MTRQPPAILQRPWHVLLSPLVPILSLLLNVINLTPPHVALGSMAIGLVASLLAWLVLSALARNRQTAAIVTTTVTLAILSYSTIEKLGAGVPLAVPVVYVCLFLFCGRTLWRGGEALEETAFANLVVGVLAVIFASSIVWYELYRPRIDSPDPIGAVGPLSRETTKPDIYVFVLDAYGRRDVLKELFGLNDGLAPSLEQLGFQVAAHAHSNYAQTALSMASALNLDYVQPFVDGVLTPDRRLLADLIRRNRVFSSLRTAGYDLVTYASEYPLIQPDGIDERRRPWIRTTEFAFNAYEESAVPEVSQWLGDRSWLPRWIHRHQILWTLDDVANHRADGVKPIFVFVHLLAPHPPFVFNADGSDRYTKLPVTLSDGEHWAYEASDTGETYPPGYAANTRFIANSVSATIQSILRRSRRPTTFYVLSDHGPGSHLSAELAETNVQERFGTLLAIRFPEEDQPPLPADTTPINGFRLLLNHAIDARLPYLPNRSYFSTWPAPFDFTDVTDMLADQSDR